MSIIFTLPLLLIGVAALNVMVGFFFWRRISLPQTSTLHTLAASFFVGLALFVSTWGVFQYIFGVRTGLIITLCLGVAVSAYAYINNYYPKLPRKTLLLLGVLLIIFLIIDFMHALVPLPTIVLNPETAPYHLGFASVWHSFRVENISALILQLDVFPQIGQNYMQAALASIPTLFSVDAPQYALVIWHGIILFMSTLLIWGTTRLFLSTKEAIIPTLFVLLGNTALSYRYISITDSHNPLLLTHNFEIITGIAFCILIALTVYSAALHRYTCWHTMILAGIGFSLSIIGAHIALIFIGAFAVTCLVIKKYRPVFFYSVGTISLSLAFGTYLLGGLLAPNAKHYAIAGLQEAVRPETKAIELRPFRTTEAEFYSALRLYYFYATPLPPTEIPQPQIEESAMSRTAILTTHTENPTPLARLRNTIATLKQSPFVWNTIRFVRSIQITFIPLAGMIALGIYLYKTKRRDWIYELAVVATPLFFGGWIIASTIFIYGQYGEISRFFAPGLLIAMFLTGYLITLLAQHHIKRLRWLAYFVVGIVLLPTLNEFLALQLVGNFTLPPIDLMTYETYGTSNVGPVTRFDALTVSERINLLVSPMTERDILRQ